MAKYPCYVCSDNCDDFCICCETCKTWSHYTCQQINKAARDQWRNRIKLPYVCVRCRTTDDESYDYVMGLERLRQASESSISKLSKAAEREQLFINNVPLKTTKHESFQHHKQDVTANTLAAYFHSTDKTALHSSADGDCLFNSISILLAGDESRSIELRYRCCLEMILNKSKIMLHPQIKRLTIICPPYDKDCISCAHTGAYSSMHMFIAMSRLLNLPIQVLLPMVNGSNNYNWKVTNTLLRPTFADPEKGTLTLMWTSMTVPNKPPTPAQPWDPKHIVPLVQNVKPELVLSMADYNKQVLDATLTKTPVSTKTVVSTKNRYSELESLPIDECDILETLQCSMKTETTKRRGTVKPKKTNSKSNHIDSASKQVGSHSIRDAAPGAPTVYVCASLENKEVETTKTNVFSPTNISTPIMNISKIDNKTNMINCHDDSYSPDNCDVSTVSTNNSYSQDDTNSAETLPRPINVTDLPAGQLLLAEELYKVINEKQNVCQSVPPGDKSDSYMLIDNTRNMGRLKNKQKCDFFDACGVWDHTKGNTIKTKFAVSDVVLKRVEFNEHNESLGNIAVYEYTGKQPIYTVAHGHSKASKAFTRTNPSTFDNVKEKLKDKSKRPREIFEELKADNSANCVRDFEVIRQKKYQEKKKEKKQTTHRTNIADEILDVIGMLTTHPFVQTIIHHKEQLPSIICYTHEQMLDLKHFLSNSHDEPLGIDRTFNLGPFYATIIVYKNQRLVRKNESTKPIFMGPLMLHKDATYKTYKGFLEHLSTEVDKDINSLELRVSQTMEFGSDDERALTKAIEHVFPGAKRLLCTKHLKDNVKHHLQNKVGMDKKERENIMTSLFDQNNGLVGADSSFEFEEKSNEIITETEINFPSFKTYFDKHLKKKLKNNVYDPQRETETKTWTNNNAESINNIIKLTTHWQPKTTPEMVEKLYSITKLHFMDYRSALHDSGNYRLTENERKKYLVVEPIWRCKTEEEKSSLFRSFLKDTKRKQPVKFVSSNENKYSVINKAPGTAKKPGQRKRPRNERTKNMTKRQRLE